MTSTPTRPDRRIEQTQYGDRQHEEANPEYRGRASVERTCYGGPQHDAEKWNAEEVHRLGYEDDHWVDGRTVRDERPTKGGRNEPAGRSNPTDEDDREVEDVNEKPDPSALLA